MAKNLPTITCPHCYEPVKRHAAFTEKYVYGDGDGDNDRQHYHERYDTWIEDSCQKCNGAVYVEIYVPEYVIGIPRETLIMLPSWRADPVRKLTP